MWPVVSGWTLRATRMSWCGWMRENRDMNSDDLPQPQEFSSAEGVVDQSPVEKEVSELTAAEFDALVEQALAEIPQQLLDQLENVAIVVEDYPPAHRPNLLGLYQGIPLTARGDHYAGVLPDRITIYRYAIERICHTYAQVVTQVKITVVHEIAHHFGIDDAALTEWGWG